jgi:hypothetical protein
LTNSPLETANDTPLRDEGVDGEKTQENEKNLDGLKERAGDDAQGKRKTDADFAA